MLPPLGGQCGVLDQQALGREEVDAVGASTQQTQSPGGCFEIVLTKNTAELGGPGVDLDRQVDSQEGCRGSPQRRVRQRRWCRDLDAASEVFEHRGTVLGGRGVLGVDRGAAERLRAQPDPQRGTWSADRRQEQ